MSGTQEAGVTIESKTWNFEPIEELGSGAKIVRMSALDLFHGDIEGKAAAESIAVLRADDSSEFAGLYRVTGELGERTGSFASGGRWERSCRHDTGDLGDRPGASDRDLVGLARRGQLLLPVGWTDHVFARLPIRALTARAIGAPDPEAWLPTEQVGRRYLRRWRRRWRHSSSLAT